MFFRSLYKHLFGWSVLAGPFAGLRYLPGSVGSVHFAKLLGTYELELRPQIEELIALAPEVVINIGAGEGYYAVGLAARLPGARVIAFETDAGGRHMIGQMAAFNGTGVRLDIRGHCSLSDLVDALPRTGNPALIIDAEGAEGELLDPEKIPALARTTMLVEVHDFVAPLGDLLRRRFAPTHSIEEIWSRPRTALDLPPQIRLMALTPWRIRAVNVMDEKRPRPMRWFWCQPLAT
jgi:hypothetical protein